MPGKSKIINNQRIKSIVKMPTKDKNIPPLRVAELCHLGGQLFLVNTPG